MAKFRPRDGDYGRGIYNEQSLTGEIQFRYDLRIMNAPRHRCRLRLFADYHQFYIWDLEISGRHAPEDWSDQDVSNRAKIAPGLVVICPVRNMHVPVEVGIWDAEPQVIFNHWQHVVEAPLRSTGRIEVESAPASHKRASQLNRAITQSGHYSEGWTRFQQMAYKEKTFTRYRFGGRHVPAYES